MPVRYIFADCELDTARYILHHHGRAIRLRPKVFQVLLYLLEHREEVVSKLALIEAVWPHQYISEATLADVIRSIRQALGDDARHPRVILTRHGHGYHFIAEVTVVAETTSTETLPLTAPLSHAARLPDANLPLAAGERKIVSILYGSLGHSTTLSEWLGLDTLHRLMHTRYDLIKRIVQQYEGTLQPLLGDRVLAVFGVPVTHEDHARRAALAALAMRDGLRAQQQTDDPRYQVALAARFGLHTGPAAVEVMGSSPEPTAMLIGDVVTLAMTFQEHAEPGSILCSEATARLLQEVVDVEPHAPIWLPEHAQSVVAYTLLAPCHVSQSRHWVRPLSPFVGRTRELATLEALLGQVHTGQGHAVVMVGEPGIGKSRLLYEFRSRQGDLHVTYWAGECRSYGTTSPYLPLLQLLRQMCGITEADVPEMIAIKVSECLEKVRMQPDIWAAPLLYLLGQATPTTDFSALSPQGRKARMFAALLELCVSSSQQRPLVLEVENVHWIDATSDEWLTALVAALAGHAILLLVTCRPEYRPEWLTASCVTALSLSRLSAKQSRQVLEAMPEVAEFAEPLTRELLVKADGNPFFLEELTRAVVEGSTESMASIPDTVQAVLAARMDRLPTSEKHLLQVASVIGKEVPRALLEGVAALPPPVLQQGLDHLRTSAFLYETRLMPDLAYTFKHALTQEVAYQSLLSSTRQPYHDRIAQLLLSRFPVTVANQPELVAHHYTEAGRVEQALPYWQRAGEQAVARSANLEAISHLTRGLDVLTALPVSRERNEHELRLQLALSAPLYMTKGPTPEVEQTYQRVLHLSQALEDNVLYFSGLAGLWRFLFNKGELWKARELGQQYFNLVNRIQDPALLTEAHLMLGSTCLAMGELHTARAHLQYGASLYETQRAQAVHQVVDPGVMCLCRGAWALWLLGYADQALRTINQALTLAKATAHAFDMASALFYTAIIHQCRREVDAVREYAEATIAFAREQELAHFVPGGLFCMGWTLAEQGAPELGLVKFHEGLETWKAKGIAANMSAAYVVLADIYHKCGQIEAGLQALDEAMHIIETQGERYYEAEVYRLRGELLLHASIVAPEQAEACFQHARDTAARQHAKALELRAVMSLSRLWHRQGHHQAARDQLEPVYTWFTEGFATLDLVEARALLDRLCAQSSPSDR